MCCACRRYYGRDYQCDYGRTYAFEDFDERGIVVDKFGCEEYRDGQDNQKRRHYSTQGGDDAASAQGYAIAYGYGNIHGQDARKRLGYGQQVKEFFAVYPAVIGDDFALYNRNHSPSAAKGEGSYLEERHEHLPK